MERRGGRESHRRLACAQAAAKHMAASGKGGSIINLASITGLRVAGAVSPYAASKAGLIQLTKAMALELARYKIRVNALAPGYIETDLNREFFQSEAGQTLIRRASCKRLSTTILHCATCPLGTFFNPI